MLLDEICQLLGPMEKDKLKLHDVSGFSIVISSAAVIIINFGEAFIVGRPYHHTGLSILIISFPPKVCFRHPPSASSDIWELNYFLFEISIKGPFHNILFHLQDAHRAYNSFRGIATTQLARSL